MRIFVGGLWAKVKWRDMEQLVAQALRGPWYKLHAPRGRMVNCELQQMKDLKSGGTEYCAVIEVEPTRLAWEVVQYLEGLDVHGRQLTSHKWFPRDGMNDRRVSRLDGEEAPQSGHERRSDRRQDRRRELDIQPLGRNMVRAVQGFERSYGS